jgi:hypothetical protein
MPRHLLSRSRLYALAAAAFGAALAAAAVAAVGLGSTEGTMQKSSLGVAGTLFLDYNTQSCNSYAKFQPLQARGDFDRVNTSWSAPSPGLTMVDIGSGCGISFDSHTANWTLSPNWGNTGDPTHAQGAWRTVSWPYLGDPSPYGSKVGAQMKFYGYSYYGTGPTVCDYVSLRNLGC